MEEQQEVIESTNEMTAGEMLKTARTTGRRKREIATISKLLCIREEFLTALEEGDYRAIPEVVYILGFARSYAVELGLDPEVVIAKLKKELGLVKEKKEEPKKEEPKKEEIKEKKEEIPEVKIVKTKPEIKKEPIKINKAVLIGKSKSAIQYVKKYWLWFLGGFALLLVIIALCVVLFAGNKKEEVAQNANNVQEIVAEEVVIPEPDFRYPIHEKFDEKNSKEARVVLQAEKESWVKIEDARGNSVFSRVLIPGDVYYLPAGDKFKATFGNVGAIDVWVDGRLIKKLGPANTKKTGISMNPDALKSVGFAE